MEEKIFVIRTSTDEYGNKPIDVETEAFKCPVCGKEIAWEFDEWIELEDGMFMCESCWQGLDTLCAICENEFWNEDIEVKICDKCAKELAK